MEQANKPPAKVTVHVDLPAVLKVCSNLPASYYHLHDFYACKFRFIYTIFQDITLEGLNAGLMPRSKEVDTLASEVRRLHEKGVKSPFVFVSVAKFNPTWSDELENAGYEDDSEPDCNAKALQDIARALGKETKKV
jgi:hypothetical protein